MLNIIYADGKSELEFLKSLEKRNRNAALEIEIKVRDIIENVLIKGDEALKEYSLKFDNAKLSSFEVSKEEMQDALNNCEPKFRAVLEEAAENIRDFHEMQKEQGFENKKGEGIVLGQKVRPLKRVGIYVPGGTAAYPSTVLMNAVPAKVAGVEEIIMVTPPMKNGGANPDILAAAAVSGVDRVFLVGGAQAIAALAYGTESIPKVDKITGPGNIYVATAKRLLYGIVDIDMIAGPSEVLIIADESAEPSYLAADMLSQAEHDVLASSVLITTSEEIAKKTIEQVELQLERLERVEIARKSIDDFGFVIVCKDIARAYEIADLIAPEHLELMVKEPMKALEKINNAGSVFLGKYSPEPLGDYFAGPNHVLPTSGTARFSSPLSTNDFMKRFNYISYDKDALKEAKDKIVLFAEKEGMTAHANSIKVRFTDEQ